MSTPSLPNPFQGLFDRQRAKRWAVAKRSAAERVEVLRKLRRAVVSRREDLAKALFQDFRKPQPEVELSEVHPVLEELDYAVANLVDWMRPKSVPTNLLMLGTHSEIRPEPKGVVLIIAPWNYPFDLAIAPLVSAVAAGNCVILKPSEKTPATSRLLVELVRSVFDESEVAVVEGGIEVGEALGDLPFDHVFFTGSTQVGRKVMQAAAKHLAGVTLELGGKSPVYVDRSADLTAAAARLTFGRFFNAGQTCIAPDYVWVHEAVERPFLDAMRAQVSHFYGPTEEARQASPDFARVIDDASFQRLKGLVERSLAAGAKAEVGAVFDAASRYVAPTVLSGVTVSSPLMEGEIFGPVLPVLRYGNLSETFSFIERKGKPLALYVFARDSKVVDEILINTSAGGSLINNVMLQFLNPNLPFGGVGPSGLGSSHGAAGFKSFSHERSVMTQGRPALSRYLSPPYGDKQKQLVARFVRALE